MDLIRNGGFLSKVNLSRRIDVIGCGAVGSYLALLLTRTGFSTIFLHDFDKVEAHNLSNQAFSHEHIGQYKSKALEVMCKAINPNAIIIASTEEVNEDNIDHRIASKDVFVVPDNMECRRLIYETIKYSEARIVEGRLGDSQYQVYSLVTPNSKYEQALSIDGERAVSLCGTPVTLGYAAQALASYMVSQYICLFDGLEGELLVSHKPPCMMLTEWQNV